MKLLIPIIQRKMLEHFIIQQDKNSFSMLNKPDNHKNEIIECKICLFFWFEIYVFYFFINFY